MEEKINIDYYKDYKNVTIAEFVVAKHNAETLFINAIKNAKIKDALKAASLYIQLDKLANKKAIYGEKYGYDRKSR